MPLHLRVISVERGNHLKFWFPVKRWRQTFLGHVQTLHHDSLDVLLWLSLPTRHLCNVSKQRVNWSFTLPCRGIVSNISWLTFHQKLCHFPPWSPHLRRDHLALECHRVRRLHLLFSRANPCFLRKAWKELILSANFQTHFVQSLRVKKPWILPQVDVNVPTQPEQPKATEVCLQTQHRPEALDSETNNFHQWKHVKEG